MDSVLKQSSWVHREIRHFQSGHGPGLCMENFRQAFSLHTIDQPFLRSQQKSSIQCPLDRHFGMSQLKNNADLG